MFLQPLIFLFIFRCKEYFLKVIHRRRELRYLLGFFQASIRPSEAFTWLFNDPHPLMTSSMSQTHWQFCRPHFHKSFSKITTTHSLWSLKSFYENFSFLRNGNEACFDAVFPSSVVCCRQSLLKKTWLMNVSLSKILYSQRESNKVWYSSSPLQTALACSFGCSIIMTVNRTLIIRTHYIYWNLSVSLCFLAHLKS